MSTSHNIIVDQLVGDESFRAWAEGRADADEKTYWDNWVQSAAKNRRLARRAQQEIIGFSFHSQVIPHTDSAWQRLQQRIANRGRRIQTVRRPRPVVAVL